MQPIDNAQHLVVVGPIRHNGVKKHLYHPSPFTISINLICSDYVYLIQGTHLEIGHKHNSHKHLTK